MSWTPYIGDPSVGGTAVGPPHANLLRGLASGMSKALAPLTSRRAGMSEAQRLQVSMSQDAGVMQFTPDQLYFRDSIGGGRWGDRIACAPNMVADTNLNLIKRYPDGTCDLIGLEADGKFYIDLGGQGGRDMRAGKP